MKAKITRTTLPNAESYFTVKVVMPDGQENTISCFNFKENSPEDSVWNEAKNLAAALEMAHRIESGVEKQEAIVYETPLDEVDKSINELI